MTDVHDMIGSSTVSEGGQYFLAGIYPVVQVDTLQMKKSQRNGHNLFIAEFEILKSEVEGRPVGSRVGWVRDLDGEYPESNAGEIKGLLAAITDSEPDEVDGDTSRAAVSSKQPAHGRLIRVEAFRKDGKEFVNTRFIALPDDMQKKAGELRKKAGLTAPF